MDEFTLDIVSRSCNVTFIDQHNMPNALATETIWNHKPLSRFEVSDRMRIQTFSACKLPVNLKDNTPTVVVQHRLFHNNREVWSITKQDDYRQAIFTYSTLSESYELAKDWPPEGLWWLKCYIGFTTSRLGRLAPMLLNGMVSMNQFAAINWEVKTEQLQLTPTGERVSAYRPDPTKAIALEDI